METIEIRLSDETAAYIKDVVEGEMGMPVEEYIIGTILLSLGMSWAPECSNNALWNDDFYGL